MLPLPPHIGRYQIKERIAEGGMGSLFLAWDPSLERQVAIKVLRDDTDALRERFSREGRAAARLKHPNIVTIFDVGEQEGQPFIAMEYIKGQTLAEFIRQRVAAPVDRKLQLVEQLCDGLGFAHRAGVIHRDVKPANLIIESTTGDLKILDFGIARLGTAATQVGTLVGSLNYMSPEQVEGRPVDQRTDVFAVGAVAYELLTYRQAFGGGLDSGVLNRILNRAPEPLSSLLPTIDLELERAISRALEKNPADRYPDLHELRDDVRRIRLRQSAGAAVLEPPLAPGPPTRSRGTLNPRTLRRDLDREGLVRKRRAQIDERIQAARVALTRGELDAAMTACEEALVLDSDDAQALAMLDRVRAAIDVEHVKHLTAEAAQRFDQGDLDRAQELVGEALSIDAHSDRATELSAAIAHERDVRARTEQGRQVLATAQSRLAAEDYEAAIEAADRALALIPDDAQILKVRQDAERALRARQQRLLDERAQLAVTEARHLFSEDRHTDAIRLLETFAPPRTDVTHALEQLRHDLRALERAREEAARRARSVALALDVAARAASHEVALAALEEALALEPTNAEARRLFDQRTAALEQERAADRRRATARDIAAVAEHHLASDDLEAASAVLARADDSDEARPILEPVRQRLEQMRERAAALERERQRQHERELATAAAIERAHAALSHEVAIAAFRHVLELDPSNAEARAGLQHRQELLARERAVRAALADAALMLDHKAAIATLREALALDPDNSEIREHLSERELALESELALEPTRVFTVTVPPPAAPPPAAPPLPPPHEVPPTGQAAVSPAPPPEAGVAKPPQPEPVKAAPARKSAKAKGQRREPPKPQPPPPASAQARSEPAGSVEPAAGADVRARVEPQEAGPPPSVPDTFHRTPPELAGQRTAAPQRPQHDWTETITPLAGLLRDRRAQIGLAAVVLLIGLWLAWSVTRPTPAPIESTTATSTAGSPNGGVSIGGTDTIPGESPTSNAGATSTADTPSATGSTSTGAANPSGGSGRGAPSASDAPSGRSTSATDTTANTGRTSTPDARPSGGARPAASPSSGSGSTPSTRDTSGTGGTTSSTDARAPASGAGGSSSTRAEPSSRPPSSTSTTSPSNDTPSTGGAASGPETTANAGATAGAGTRTTAIPDAPPIVTPPPAPAPRPDSAPSPAPPPAPAISDEDAIRSVLRAYAAAYSALDVQAVGRVFPSANFGSLQQGFSQLEEQDVTLDGERIQISGTSATVRCQWQVRARPKVGRSVNQRDAITLTLRKTNGSWEIVGRR